MILLKLIIINNNKNNNYDIIIIINYIFVKHVKYGSIKRKENIYVYVKILFIIIRLTNSLASFCPP